MDSKNIIFIVLFLVVSCGKQNVLNNEKLKEHDLKLFILPFSLKKDTSLSDLIIKKNVVIDKPGVVKNMITKWRGARVNNRSPQFTNQDFYYTGIIVEENKDSALSYFYFQKDFSKIRTKHGVYSFEPNLLLKYKEHFNSLNCFKVCLDSIENARKLIETIRERKAFVSSEKYDWEKFKGFYQLRRKEPDIPSGQSISNYMEVLIEKDFSNTSQKIKYKEMRPIENSDSTMIKVLADSLVRIPQEYKVEKEFEVFKNLCFKTLDVKQDELYKLSNDLKINAIQTKKCRFSQ